MQNPSSVSYLVATKGILHNNRLLTLALKANISHYNSYSQSKYNQAVLAWGQKKSRQKADKLAKQWKMVFCVHWIAALKVVMEQVLFWIKQAFILI